MNDGRIAAMKPSSAHRRGGGLRIVVIACHDHVPVHNDFADGRAIVGHLNTIVVDDPKLSRGNQLDALAGLDPGARVTGECPDAPEVARRW